MSDPDIVYVVRQSEKNEELRHSLWSLSNLPHRRVFIAGYCPSWVKNVTAIPVRRGVNKFDNIEANLRAALAHPELGENALFFNDDFFILQPIDEIPVMHRGPVNIRAFAQEFRTRMQVTLNALTTIPNPFDYELHVPLPLETKRARMLMGWAPKKIMWRTWYGNAAALGGSQALDVKSRHGEVHDSCLLSSSPRAFSSIRPFLHDRLQGSAHEYS